MNISQDVLVDAYVKGYRANDDGSVVGPKGNLN